MAYRSLNALCMPAAPAPMESSLHTATGRTSPQLLSSPPKTKKHRCLSVFPLLPAVVAVLIQPVMCTGLRRASTQMKEISVRIISSIVKLYLTYSDIVGNNIPVFFIQDAILFPDLIHAVKPRGDNEIPQAATAHDSAWDFFSQQPSSLHTLLWAMAGHGIPRSFRHVDGFGIHTYRFVTDNGTSKLVKFHWKTLQGKASFVWEEAQQTAGKNADFIRQDLFDSIEAGRYPEWEVSDPNPTIIKFLTTSSSVFRSWTKKTSSASDSTSSTLPKSYQKN